MNFRPATPEQIADVDIGYALLKQALKLFKSAGAVNTADRVRLALKSAEGARRHVRHRAMRTGENGQDTAMWKQDRLGPLR